MQTKERIILELNINSGNSKLDNWSSESSFGRFLQNSILYKTLFQEDQRTPYALRLLVT